MSVELLHFSVSCTARTACHSTTTTPAAARLKDLPRPSQLHYSSQERCHSPPPPSTSAYYQRRPPICPTRDAGCPRMTQRWHAQHGERSVADAFQLPQFTGPRTLSKIILNSLLSIVPSSRADSARLSRPSRSPAKGGLAQSFLLPTPSIIISR